jgi:hypothetical protein
MESLAKASTLCVKLEKAGTLCTESVKKFFDVGLQKSQQLRDLRAQAVIRSQTLHEVRCDYWQLAHAHQFRNRCAAEGAVLEDLSDEFLETSEDLDERISTLQEQLHPLRYASLSVFCKNLEENVLGHLPLVDLIRFAASAKALRSGVERMLPMVCSNFVFTLPVPPTQGLPRGLIRNGPQIRSSRQKAHPTMDLSTRFVSLLRCAAVRPHFQHLDLSAVPAATLSTVDVQQAIASLPSLVSVTYPSAGWQDPTELRVFKTFLEGKGIASHLVRRVRASLSG